MRSFHVLSRRSFLDRGVKLGLGVALSTLVDIPFVMKRALAEGTIGQHGKKLLFIFLRGGMDGLNTLVPIQDSAYGASSRPDIFIPTDPGTDYSAAGPCDFPVGAASTDPTFHYTSGIRTGNGFAALHPSLKFLAPVYNAGDLALIHRVAYPRQSRSHFDSQNYWENGDPNNDLLKDGVFYRTMVESGLAHTSPLTGVSVQSSLPLSLRGSNAAMTNLVNPTRYSLQGVPATAAGDVKAMNALRLADGYPFASKKNRELLDLQYQNLTDTISIFQSLNFSDSGNTFVDDSNTDGDTAPYYLFPTSNAKNGGYALHNNDANKYVVDTGAYGFFTNLKAAALVLNKTDAIIAGSELNGFDTHSNQGRFTGQHPNLLKTLGWAMYALRKYFLNYADQATWDNLVIVTLSEFGRTSIQNSNAGTDHAEASAMFLAGGAVKGYKKGNSTGVFGCSPNDTYNGQSLPWVTGNTGSMFGASSRYLKRAVDYRSVLGEVIRDHLGATADQLNRIIPGYANAAEALQTGGLSLKDNTHIAGELGLV
jgi:uncharacterized protein (DUF1501 family)